MQVQQSVWEEQEVKKYHINIIFQTNRYLYMTLKNIIELLKTIALSKPTIRYVGDGNVFDLNSVPDFKYGVFYITQQGSDIYENQEYHKLTLFFIDRLTDEADNKLQIQSNGQREISNIVNTLMDMEDVYVNYPLSFTSFNQRFADDCAGVFSTITFITDREMGNCYYE